MEKLKKLFTIGLVAFLILFIIIVLNQVVSIYNNLSTINPYLGIFAAIVTVGLLFIVVGVQIYGIFRFPKQKTLPKNPTLEEIRDFKKDYVERLKRNKYLNREGYEFHGENIDEVINNAHYRLKKIAMEKIKEDANSVFITTAISQNGVLDGLAVLFTLAVMVYRITEIYENRPSARRLLSIYSHIASTVLIVGSIEDLDLIEEQLEPLLTSLLGSSILSAIPGAVNVTALVTNSLVEGSVNALLTLRVGIVTQRYLESFEDVDKRILRRGATYESTKYLGAIIARNGANVVKAITKAAKKATIDKIPNPFSKKEPVEDVDIY